MTWNRQYRPKSFAQLHLNGVRDALSAVLLQPRLPQVYLFAGPKGTGKTSASRILAAILNDPANAEAVKERLSRKNALSKKTAPLQEPNLQDEFVSRVLSGNSLTVHELDAASNRGIDDVRALKERVYLPPQEGIVSVFILDEAHMLTNEASNALLKILEEPPTHVVFILATTEQHKILPTIVSRAYTVQFSKASIPELSSSLSAILTAENIAFDPDSLEILAQRADGSFRDAVKLLETVSGNGTALTKKLANETVGSDLTTIIIELLHSVVAKDMLQVSQKLQVLREKGVSDSIVHTLLLEWLHQQLLVSIGVATGKSVWSTQIIQFLLQEFSDPKVGVSAPIPLLAIELKCLDLISRSQKKKNEEPVQTTKSKEPEQKLKRTTPAAPTTSKIVEKPTSIADGSILCEKWDEFVRSVAAINNSLAAFLQSAQPLQGSLGTATIRVFYAFHKDQLVSTKSQSILQQCIIQLCGGTIDLHFELTAPVPAEIASQSQTTLATVAASALM